MSSASELIHRAREIRHRLMYPDNAREDHGIDLKRKRIPKVEIIPPPELPIETENPVVEYQQTTEYEILPLSQDVILGLGIIPAPIHHLPVKLEIICKIVSDYFNVSTSDLKGHSRRAVFILPRHVAFYLAAHLTKLSLPRIARFMGKYDHTSVLHGRNKIRDLLQTDDILAAKVAELKRRILEKAYANLTGSAVATVSHDQNGLNGNS